MKTTTRFEGGFFHLYNRGVDKRPIFSDDHDWGRIWVTMNALRIGASFREFLRSKNMTNKQPLVDIICCCFMPNHFHFLVQERKPDGISEFMGRLSNSFTKYFNTKYRRTGRLFESKYKMRPVNEDGDLCSLSRYIHLNPLKLLDPAWKERGLSESEAIGFLRRYPWSSLDAYLSPYGSKEISTELIRGFYPKPDDYLRFLTSKIPEPKSAVPYSHVKTQDRRPNTDSGQDGKRGLCWDGLVTGWSAASAG